MGTGYQFRQLRSPASLSREIVIAPSSPDLETGEERTMTTFATTALNAVGFSDADLVNVATRVVAIPMREFYGLLWQAGVLQIAD
jgi:hypothetical protein